MWCGKIGMRVETRIVGWWSFRMALIYGCWSRLGGVDLRWCEGFSSEFKLLTRVGCRAEGSMSRLTSEGFEHWTV